MSGLGVSHDKLVAGVVFLNQFANMCGNVAVTQGQYSQNIDDLAS